MTSEVVLHGLDQLGDRAENATPESLLGQIPEKALDHVEPRRTGWREVHMKTLVTLEPVDDFLMFVSRIVLMWISLSFGMARLDSETGSIPDGELWHAGSMTEPSNVERGEKLPLRL